MQAHDLLDYSLICEFLKVVKTRGKKLLRHLDLSFIDEIFEKLKTTKRGKPRDYSPSQDFKGILYGLAEGELGIRGIARKLEEITAKHFLGFKEDRAPSPSTLSRFLGDLSSVVEEVFSALVRIAVQLGVIGDTFIVDSTSIETPFRSDCDARWNYDATKKEYYFGYGLILVVDLNHIPVAAMFSSGKHVSRAQALEIVGRALEAKRPVKFIGDSEFDVKAVNELLLEHRVLPVIKFNPRNSNLNSNSKKEVKYRVQALVRNRSNKVELDVKQLDKDYRQRIEGEHSNSTIKRMGLERLTVKGWNAVKTHAFLILILRLLQAITLHKESPKNNLRKSIIEL